MSKSQRTTTNVQSKLAQLPLAFEYNVSWSDNKRELRLRAQ
ncbi:MAG: hypothetical protein WAQ22_03335 [Candidatus Saccharimonas sp.]